MHSTLILVAMLAFVMGASAEFVCPHTCHGHGECLASGDCTCTDGYLGYDCSMKSCGELNDCNGHGVCYDGKCYCEDMYAGDDCADEACVNDCSEKGDCIKGFCHCYPGLGGADCSVPTCYNDCGGHGLCLTKTDGESECSCDEGWAGVGCEIPKCIDACSGHGSCDLVVSSDGHETYACMCEEGFFGAGCNMVDGCEVAGVVCSNKGVCVPGGPNVPSHCFCEPEWGSKYCERYTQCETTECGANGVCDTTIGLCTCAEGWEGAWCEYAVEKEFLGLQCVNNCNGHGNCINEKCTCYHKYFGESCEFKQCPGEPVCGGRDHGTCEVDGTCTCFAGFEGVACGTATCENGCFGNGLCLPSKLCKCFPGFKGALCEEYDCPNDCGEHGKCAGPGLCVCDDGWASGDCSEEMCVRGGEEKAECGGNGVCHRETRNCLCENGWGGEDCTNSLCQDNCNDRGSCVDGECICSEGWDGALCDHIECIHGIWSSDHCICAPNYAGVKCDVTVADSKRLSVCVLPCMKEAMDACLTESNTKEWKKCYEEKESDCVLSCLEESSADYSVTLTEAARIGKELFDHLGELETPLVVDE